MPNTYILRKRVSQPSDLAAKQSLISADGAAGIALNNFVDTYFITKGTAAAITLAAPTAGLPRKGGHDGMRITFVSTTAAAHTVTNSSPGFNNNGGSSDVGTFGVAIGNGFTVEAYNGAWYVVSSVNVTLG